MSFFAVFEKMMQLFLIIAVGYVAGKLHFLTKEMRMFLASFVLHITLPAIILSSVFNAETLPSARQFLVFFGMVLLNYLIVIVLSWVLVRLCRFSADTSGTAMFILMFSNTAYMGFPVTQAIWGTGALLYTTMFNMPGNILADTIGASLILRDKRKKGNNKKTKEENTDGIQRRSLKQMMTTPIFISSCIAFFFALTKFPVPGIVGYAAQSVGGITVPAAMMIIGASLSEMPWKEMFGNPRVYLLAALRLAVMPLLIRFIFSPLLRDPLTLDISTVLVGMPVAAVGQMLCLEYRCNEKLMADTIFITTLFSAVTIPLLTAFLT